MKGNGIGNGRGHQPAAPLTETPETPKIPETPDNDAIDRQSVELDEVDVAALRLKHGDLIVALDRLAEMKRKADAGEIEHAIFQAELRALADRYRKQGMTAAEAMAAVEQRLRPPMDSDEAWLRLTAAGSQRDEVLQLGLTGELWHDPDLEGYATIEHGGRRETWKVRSRDYRLLLSSEYRNRHGRVPTGQALAEGIEAIEAEARNSGEREAFVRLAAAGDKIYLDLANESWTVVEIDAAGWRVIGRPPVYFVRPRGLRALPDPRACSGPDGIAKLQALVNLQGDDFLLYVSWILACLRARGPYPILALSGEHGAAKSMAVRIARDLVDPGKVKLSGPPRSEQDLAIAASKRHVVAYDNLSRIDGWLADALCRLATGGGLQTRMLFTDDEQHLIDVCRPIAVTGIPDLTSRADFADRAIVAVLKPITEGRLEADEVLAQFETSAPEILGALLTGVSQALRDRAQQSKTITQKPRMADFAVWAAAAMSAFGWTAAEFLRAYEANRQEAVARVLEADPVAEAVIAFARQAYSWERFGEGTVDESVRVWKGTAGALLGALAQLVPEDTRRERGWPPDGARLSGRLRRVAPALRTKGNRLDFGRCREGTVHRLISVTVPDDDQSRVGNSKNSVIEG